MSKESVARTFYIYTFYRYTVKFYSAVKESGIVICREVDRIGACHVILTARFRQVSFLGRTKI